MFKPIKGGKKISIQGLDCWIPPEGVVLNKLTNEFEARPIYKRSEIKKEQYWEIPKKPENVKERLIEEAYKREENPTFFDTELQQYREEEWDRRLNGFWFYNNGKPTYVTGVHYFYLAHWYIDIGYVSFRIPNMELFYFWQYCVEDPDSFGMVEVTARRDGKSYRAACIQYESTSRGLRRRSGIQSKDEQSAIEFFDVHIVQPFTELEHMFKPTIDIQKGEAPKKKLSFSKKVNRSSKRVDQEKSRRTKELRSLINYGSQGEKVYDGKKQHVYVRDEAGKVEGCSVYEAHSIIKFCLIDMSDIIGKAIYTTTVEDINDDDNEKGNFKKLWHNSNQSEKGKSGRTITGLYRYFLPAYRTRNFDAYGFPDEDKSLIEFQNEREGLSDHDLIEYIRKFPFSIEEAFWTSADNCIFNKAKIQRARMELEQINPKDLYEVGNLHWKDGVFGSSVVFTETPNGKFKFHKKFNVRAECEARNTTKGPNNRYKPLRKAHRVIGVDPVDHKSTVAESTRSNVGMALYIKYNPLDELSETFVSLYLHRPDDPETGYQDMLMLAHMSGAEMMIENNKPGAVQFAEKVGYYDFVIRTGNTGGVNANGKTHQVLASNWEVYIDNSLEKIIFIEILSDLSKFNLIKTTKFDAAMAAGWALVGAYGTRAQELYGTDAIDSPIYDSAGFY
jgi:hypothetical protein